jgi:hypothetical protein
LSQLKLELRQIGVSLNDFAAKVLGDPQLSGSVLTHPQRRLDELDSEVLPKFLRIQVSMFKNIHFLRSPQKVGIFFSRQVFFRGRIFSHVRPFYE